MKTKTLKPLYDTYSSNIDYCKFSNISLFIWNFEMNCDLGLRVIFLFLLLHFSESVQHETLIKGSSLSVDNLGDVLMSPNGEFCAGFYPFGQNAYAFAIWFSRPTCFQNCTVVWIANRDQPVNGKRSRLTLLEAGNLLLTDAAQFTVWETKTNSHYAVQLQLSDIGNLILKDSKGVTLWQSFDFPTDTLLPQQLLTRDKQLVSDRSRGNSSAGFYRLFFDDDNVLRLVFDGPKVSSLYWYEPWLVSWEAGRSTYNSSRIAVFDSLGSFRSSDDLRFHASDYGAILQRRLKLDFDGNLRLYSREERNETWVVSWQAIQQPCRIHGICGENSLCSYIPPYGRKCSCLLGYTLKNGTDWPYGCKPEFEPFNNSSGVSFIQLSHVEFYGYDFGFYPDSTFENCKSLCLKSTDCEAFQYKYMGTGIYDCYLKLQLLNGHQAPNFVGDLYLKLPKANLSSYKKKIGEGVCSETNSIKLNRKYKVSNVSGTQRSLLWFASALGGIEIIGFLAVLWSLHMNKPEKDILAQGYLPATTRLRRFTYLELKKATNNFSEEIGRGGGGIVYKGMLPDKRVAAIKRLNDARQGEAEFLAEVSTIGMLNHMNLIEMWGYCVDKKHRLLVYEFMEQGSLADKLSSNDLDWKRRYEIALGTARGLAYLHEECLDWVLHCDVKPQNILLDAEFHPKVSDFGLSKLLVRGEKNYSRFSGIRGTRGYMAPEWVFNLPITSKVDVYSFGIVVLEMVTGKAPTTGFHEGGETEYRRLVNWVREKRNEADSMAAWLQEIADPMLGRNNDLGEVEVLVATALQCVEEDRDVRPTMRAVVEMLRKEDTQIEVRGTD